MDDLISRQVAMEMLMAQNVIMDGSEYHNGFNAGVNRAQEVIRNLSPVQSDVPVINVGDMISRQDAIKAICEDIAWLESQGCTEITMAERKQRDVDIIEDLPPVQLGTNLAEVGTDLVSKRAAIDAVYKCNDIFVGDMPVMVVKADAYEALAQLPSAQPERTCVNCGRTANNGGWYADGRTRCPIEEHYALPKDGFCHLWEKRSVTDDDYPERRTDG